MARRNGYTDHAEPIFKLRKALADAIRANKRMSREDLVKFGVEKLLNSSGLFNQYENEFKGYIVSNAISMAENDIRAGGIDPVRGTDIPDSPTPPKPKNPPAPPLPKAVVEAEKEQAKKAATERLVELAPVIFMKMPTPFRHEDGTPKTLGELTGKEGRQLTGGLAKFYKDIPANKRLMDVKSEAKLRELWAKI